MMPTQRQWNSLGDVDAGLTDEWLEGMNSLRCWDVVSCCEGHPGGTGSYGSGHAKICFELTPEYERAFSCVWGSSLSDLREITDRHLSCNQTRWELSYRRDCSNEEIHNIEHPRRSEVPQDVREMLGQGFSNADLGSFIGLIVEHMEPRQTEDMPSSVAVWFDEIIAGLQNFDRVLREVFEGM